MAAAAEDEDETEDTAGGVGPGVAGDPSEVISVPLWPEENFSEANFSPPAPPFEDSLAPGCEGVRPPPPPPVPPPPAEPASLTAPAEPAPTAVAAPLPPLPPPPLLAEEPPELPLSLFWLRSFSSRRHLALRFENQTCFWNFGERKMINNLMKNPIGFFR